MTRPAPDRSYRLDAAMRSRLNLGVDANALEQLLQLFPTDARDAHLEMFLNCALVADSEGRIPHVTVLVRISDPAQQRLLEEVWQPYWDAMTDVELKNALGGPPGRELTQQRRAERGV